MIRFPLGVLLVASMWAAVAGAQTSTNARPLTSAERAAATQLSKQYNAPPQKLAVQAPQLYASLSRVQGEVLVITYQMPQALADALVKAARGGARVTVLTDQRGAPLLLPLKKAGIALYKTASPVDQGVVVYGSTVLTGTLVNKVERQSAAYTSATTAETFRATWPTLLKISVKL
ncbi:hypothetical protein GO986_12335 [Deinococcus sp. HMF7620]|uniref:Phospholipase D-like domain-containing protein n=1 Tax=Deinococcus arboris TaxID=2682977 RepID=A0A7C9HS62_9DEIO|nr:MULTISPECIES: hypothetical protein [Deinococcus]MBZ9752191.1 hypothetical protein [Deinococcus betulae]MVN87554.1 hypothetical protein [Deinococcus arboris]